MESATADTPGERPRDGAAWLASLRAAHDAVDRPRRLRRTAAFATAFVVVGLAVAGLATWRVWERQIPGGRPTVAVADFVNETGDPELDGISGLLITALEQGTQLRVLTRGRMLDVLKQLGRQEVQRIDEPLAREVGRQVRADALLLASIRQLGSGLVVEMRALDPLHDEYVFTVSERASTKDAVFQVVDRLAATTRGKLGVTGTGDHPAPPIAAITTANPKAWDTYSRALLALNRTGPGGDAEALARQAVAEDPDFALARLLALVSRWPQWGPEVDGWLSPEDEAQARRELDALEPLASRLPERERMVLRTLRLGLDGKWDEVRALRDRLAAAFPLDKEAQYLAGDVRFHSDDVAAAIPYFKRALQLDPGYRIVGRHVARALLITGTAADEVPWLREQAPLAASGPEERMFALAFLSAGLEAEGTALLRRSTAQDVLPWPPGPLARWWIHAGRAPEAEQAARETLAACAREPRCAGTAREKQLRDVVVEALVAQGRHRESREVLVSLGPASIPPYRVVLFRQWLAASARNRAALDEATQEVEGFGEYRSRDGGNWLEAPKSAMVTALAGRLDLAVPVARMVLEGGAERSAMSGEWFLLTAIVASAGAGPAETPPAVAEAARLPQVFWRFPGSVLLGHHLKERGDCRGAIAAYENALEVPWHPLTGERPYFVPSVLHALAACHEELGDLAKARERNAELLRLWTNADPDLPLLVEAKAMRERLGGRPGQPQGPSSPR